MLYDLNLWQNLALAFSSMCLGGIMTAAILGGGDGQGVA